MGIFHSRASDRFPWLKGGGRLEVFEVDLLAKLSGFATRSPFDPYFIYLIFRTVRRSLRAWVSH